MLNLGIFKLTGTKIGAIKTVIAIVLGLTHSLAYAVPINVNVVRTDIGSWASIGYDAITGTYYSRQDAGFQSNQLRAYDDINAFRANNYNQTHTVQNYGTYFAVRDGKHFGRVDNNSNAVQRIDIDTGAVEATSNVAGMAGRNVQDTFNWGGYSGVNFIQTATGMNVLGGDAGNSGSGLVVGIDDNLNTSTSISFPNRPGFGANLGWGYAFSIGQQIFLGEGYNSNNVVGSIDLGTGAFSAVDFSFEGLTTGSSAYWTSTVYDHLSDTLFLANHNDSTLYEVNNAAAAFGVNIATSVPEPSSMGLITLGAGYLVLLRRRRNSQ